ncbi:hypothetical protein MUP32_05195 [Candidatus Microgenomates bacterium]|nr:hypothetical protein [Candidatus Microgenomates bacterium]
MAEVIPAILEKDFPEIEKKIRLVEGLVSWVQIDLADGTLVPNTTFLDPQPFMPLIKHMCHPELVSGSKGMPDQVRHDLSVNFELHLMVKDPLKYIEPFAKSGFKRFFAHVEGEKVEEYIEECNRLDVEIGLAIDGPTSWEAIHKYLDDIDAVLVMAIEAGFSGRPFREDTVEKIRKIREIDLEIPIAVDGAMTPENAAKVVAAGATRINSNSYIFNSPDIKEAIEKLENLPYG